MSLLLSTAVEWPCFVWVLCIADMPTILSSLFGLNFPQFQRESYLWSVKHQHIGQLFPLLTCPGIWNANSKQVPCLKLFVFGLALIMVGSPAAQLLAYSLGLFFKIMIKVSCVAIECAIIVVENEFVRSA